MKKLEHQVLVFQFFHHFDCFEPIFSCFKAFPPSNYPDAGTCISSFGISSMYRSCCPNIGFCSYTCAIYAEYDCRHCDTVQPSCFVLLDFKSCQRFALRQSFLLQQPRKNFTTSNTYQLKRYHFTNGLYHLFVLLLWVHIKRHYKWNTTVTSKN